jgi:exoribonuclease II
MKVMRKSLKIRKSSKFINNNQCYELLEGDKVIGIYINEEKAEDAKENRMIENRANRAVKVIPSDLASTHFSFVTMSIYEI